MTPRRDRAFFAVALALLFAPSVSAQAEPPDALPVPPRVREEVLVTAERGPEERGATPAAVSVLTREEIARAPADNLAELLPLLPGVQVLFAHRYSGTVPMVGARGFFGGGEAEYVQLRVDGVPVGNVESGLADWRSLAASDIERIELLRGPASSLYGDTALAGVIQVFTRRRAADGPRWRASLGAGSFGAADVAARGGTRAGPWIVELDAEAFRTEGFRGHSAAAEAGGGVSVERRVGGGTLTARVEGRAMAREEPGPLRRRERERDPESFDPIFDRDEDDAGRARASVTFRQEGPVPLRASLSAGTRRSDLVRTLLLAPGVGDRALRELSTAFFTGAVEGEATPRPFGREGRLLLGAELGREWLRSVYRPVDDAGDAGDRAASARGRRDRLAVFLLQEVNVAPRVRVTGGVRWDLLDEEFGALGSPRRDAWSPRIGVNVRLGSPDRVPVAVFFAASRAFKAPTLDQLYDPRPLPDFQGGAFSLANPALRPQRAWNLELGAFHDGPSTRVDLSLYGMAVDDEIDFDPATLRYSNIGDSRHDGVEAGLRHRVGRFAASLSYAWTRARPRGGENAGQQLKNIPEHTLRAGLDVALPGAAHVALQYGLAARRYLDDANRHPLADLSTWDVRIDREFGAWRARVDLLNVTNEDDPQLGFALPDFVGGEALYEYPAAGFAARAGIEIRF